MRYLGIAHSNCLLLAVALFQRITTENFVKNNNRFYKIIHFFVGVVIVACAHTFTPLLNTIFINEDTGARHALASANSFVPVASTIANALTFNGFCYTFILNAKIARNAILARKRIAPFAVAMAVAMALAVARAKLIKTFCMCAFAVFSN